MTVPHKRDLQLGKYSIDKYQYRELHNFCLQYSRKKQQAASLIGLQAVPSGGMPSGGLPGDTTSRQAELREQLLRDCELIEQTAIAVDAAIYQNIIANVTEQIPFEYMAVPCGRRQFYELRRKFFFLLAKKRKMI